MMFVSPLEIRQVAITINLLYLFVISKKYKGP